MATENSTPRSSDGSQRLGDSLSHAPSAIGYSLTITARSGAITHVTGIRRAVFRFHDRRRPYGTWLADG